LSLYLDSSALTKLYVEETGSAEVRLATQSSLMRGTSILSRAEVGAALRKGCRTKAFDETSAKRALRAFDHDWNTLVRLRVGEALVKQAAGLAWTHHLRGYDSIHLATAAAWQQALQFEVSMATFDQDLWNAAKAIGLDVFPPDLPAWRKQHS
jgi:uncharacterized protein